MDVRDLFRLIVFKGERWGGICGVLFYYEDEIDRQEYRYSLHLLRDSRATIFIYSL